MANRKKKDVHNAQRDTARHPQEPPAHDEIISAEDNNTTPTAHDVQDITKGHQKTRNAQNAHTTHDSTVNTDRHSETQDTHNITTSADNRQSAHDAQSKTSPKRPKKGKKAEKTPKLEEPATLKLNNAEEPGEAPAGKPGGDIDLDNITMREALHLVDAGKITIDDIMSKEAQEAAGKFGQTLAKAVETFKGVSDYITNIISSESYKQLKSAIEGFTKRIAADQKAAQSKLNKLADVFDHVTAPASNVDWKKLADRLKAAKELVEEAKRLATFIKEVLEENPDYGLSYDDFLNKILYSPDDNIPADIKEILDKAREKEQRYTETAAAVKEIEELHAQIQEQPHYLPVLWGKPTSAIAFANPKKSDIDKLAQKTLLQVFDVQIQAALTENFENLLASLSVRTDKLLNLAISSFTQNNNAHQSNINCDVIISLKDYAELLNYDVTERETDTKEAAIKEKRRVKSQLDHAKEAVKKDLKTLYETSLSWQDNLKNEKTKKYETADFIDIRLVDAIAIKKGYIYLSFTAKFAEYLTRRNTIGQYPIKLFGLDNRKDTAYKIARKLFEHYFIDKNIMDRTRDTLKISNILKVTPLATYEEVQKTDRGHWEERIKEPFERALDDLQGQGILKEWEYTHQKKEPLTDEEAANITTYQNFESLYLHFTPKDDVDQTERLQKKQEQREKAKKEKEKRKQRAIQKNIEKKKEKGKEKAPD